MRTEIRIGDLAPQRGNELTDQEGRGEYESLSQ